MNMSLKNLLFSLHRYDPKIFACYSKHTMIENVKILEYRQSDFEPSIIYIGKSSCLSKTLPENCVASILCILDKPIPEAYKSHKYINLITVGSNHDLTNLFFEICDIFSGEHRSNKLLWSLVSGKGIQHIINTASQILDKPIYLLDASFKLIAFAGNPHYKDPLWNDITSKGYLSPESVAMIKATKSLEKVNKSNKPVIIEKYKEYSPCIVTRVLVDNKLAANLTVLGNEVPFTEADVETVEVLREVISVELQKSKPKLNEKGVMYEYFLKDLLDGKIRKDEVISERMKYLDLNLKENLYLVSVFTRQSDFLNTPLQYISNKFENLIIGCKSFVYNDQIIILISTDQAASSLKSDIEKLESFLEQNNMYAGMSQCFHKINHIRAYYKQAVKAVELGIYLKMGRPFIKYDDCSVYHVADICAHNHNLRRFCHPAVLKLEEYDRKNNTSYLKSLYYYLINNKNQLASAEALHIHRNTLIYRIKKIDLLVDIDWNDGETLFHLLFSFKFLKYLNCRETNKKE